MLYKGKRNGFYLYELTSSDLAWEDATTHYRLGNVLLFTDKRNIVLGAEVVKADDLLSVYEYLEGNASPLNEESSHEENLLLELQQQLSSSEASLHKRDELLRDLTADLESQRTSNEVLIGQLNALREQIHIERITRDEVLGDLEVASAESYRKEQELQEAIDAKTQLEQELAARICDLLELDSANSELQKRLMQQTEEEGDSPMKPARKAGNSPPSPRPHQDNLVGTQVLTTSEGKQVHVYHEFPAHKQRAKARGSSALITTLRTLGALLVALLIFVAGSVVATAALNDMSIGEALDSTISSLTP